MIKQKAEIFISAFNIFIESLIKIKLLLLSHPSSIQF